MRHWEHHRTRSKVALLLLINLVALLGGKYMALITIVKIELFGEAMAFAKAPKKKLPKSHLNRAQRGHSPPPSITWRFPMPVGQQPRAHEHLHVIRPGDTLSEIAAAYGLSVDALRRGNRLPPTSHLIVGETLRIPATAGAPAVADASQPSGSSEAALLLALQRHFERPPRHHSRPAMPSSGRWMACSPRPLASVSTRWGEEGRNSMRESTSVSRQEPRYRQRKKARWRLQGIMEPTVRW